MPEKTVHVHLDFIMSRLKKRFIMSNTSGRRISYCKKNNLKIRKESHS